MILGGPEFCGRDVPSSYNFDEFSKENITFTLCGIPAPTVSWKFNHGALMVAPRTQVNKFTFSYTIQLPLLTQKMCGEELFIEATSEYHKTRVRRICSVFLSSCKLFTNFLSVEMEIALENFKQNKSFLSDFKYKEGDIS